MRVRGGGGWLFIAAVPTLIAGSLVLGSGRSARQASRTEASKPAAAATADSAGRGSAPAGPAAGAEPNTPPPAEPSQPPAPDPKILRALDTRVHLRAERAELWTELRRLGVTLKWPEGGEPEWSLDDHQFDRALRRLARRVERRVRNARLLHVNGSFKVLPSQIGRRMDRAEARRRLLAALAAPELRRAVEEPILPEPDVAPKPPSIQVTIPVRPVTPTVSPAHLGRINTLLATYSTSLGASSRNRRHNIRLACEAIDGTVLLPGDLFSYNDTVGPRSEQAGFRTAPVIIHGELVPGTGGGICQVSSTLYNAALLADLRVVRRSHHQFPVHYVPVGRDATVAYGSLDLRFANSLPSPVMLDVKQQGWRVIVRVFSAPECRREVRLVSSRLSWTRPRAPAGGGRPRPGKRVTVTRVVRHADGTVRREVISHDTYAPPPPAESVTPSRHRRARHRRRDAHGQQHSPLAGAEPQRAGLTVRTAMDQSGSAQ
jgi:vancomycin resistance protein YoaR